MVKFEDLEKMFKISFHGIEASFPGRELNRVYYFKEHDPSLNPYVEWSLKEFQKLLEFMRDRRNDDFSASVDPKTWAFFMECSPVSHEFARAKQIPEKFWIEEAPITFVSSDGSKVNFSYKELVGVSRMFKNVYERNHMAPLIRKNEKGITQILGYCLGRDLGNVPEKETRDVLISAYSISLPECIVCDSTKNCDHQFAACEQCRFYRGRCNCFCGVCKDGGLGFISRKIGNNYCDACTCAEPDCPNQRKSYGDRCNFH